jgi:hypothetical protein
MEYLLNQLGYMNSDIEEDVGSDAKEAAHDDNDDRCNADCDMKVSRKVITTSDVCGDERDSSAISQASNLVESTSCYDVIRHFVNAVTADGTTPMHLAARYGHLSACQLLLSAGAAVDLKDIEGNTPGTLAATWGRWRCVELLTSQKDKRTG